MATKVAPPTLDDLLKELRITPTLLDQRCSNEHLNSFSLFLDWRRIAPFLGLSEMDIQEIETDKKTEAEKRLKTLQNWKRKFGYKAKFTLLVETLLDVGNAEDAEKVCRVLQPQVHTGMGLACTSCMHVLAYTEVQLLYSYTQLLGYCARGHDTCMCSKQPVPIPSVPGYMR